MTTDPLNASARQVGSSERAFNVTKPCLVLLPGMVCDEAVFAPQLAHLDGMADILVPRYGDSCTFEDMARMVLNQAPARFAMVGHSMGGRVALEVYRLAPKRVDRLCLISTEHRPRRDGVAGEEETRGRLRLLEIARAEGMRAMGMAWLPVLLSKRNQQDTDLVESILSMVERHTPDQLEAQIWAGHSRPNSTSMLGQISCPVLLIAGEDDILRPAKILQDTASLIVNSLMETITGCGHMPTLEQPEKVNRLLQEWMSVS
ncbi:alpha/beta fold hydrolase [Pseudomonas umsongensis]|uniref:alpha/beta fold hydrolase n=1 Tax=Pseudomonas umsongensis TaxID=198618 RepID=UPI00200A25EA|nr:alpha/beta hydrolase [Pseudomonas umsongensis]MCK8681844.1 alpha/beta hydrolase [Pseudomonas umsongensis]